MRLPSPWGSESRWRYTAVDVMLGAPTKSGAPSVAFPRRARMLKSENTEGRHMCLQVDISDAMAITSSHQTGQLNGYR